MKRTLLYIVVLAIGVPLFCKEKKKADLPLASDLAAITARGRAIAEYDVAAWHATDVIQDLAPQKGSFRYYIARKAYDGKWSVVFGRLSDAHDRFLIAFEAIQGTKPEFFTDKKYDPPLENTDFYFFAAKAFDTALKDLGSVNRPYNIYAIQSETGQLYVYLLPAQTNNEIYPLGADVRYTFSADGNTLLEKHPMHKTVLEFKTDAKTQAGLHTHVLSNLPEDSDVFYVLTRKPSIPEYIGTMDKKIYVIHTDGTIALGK